MRQIAILLTCIFCCHSLISQHIPENRLKAVTTKGPNEVHQFNVCFTKPKSGAQKDREYYWYSGNEIQHNMGGYSGNLIHGPAATFDFEGRLREKGSFKLGMKSGLWLKWNDKGELLESSHYKHGRKHGHEMIYQNGSLTIKRRYRHGRPVGEDHRYENGKKVKVEKQPRPKKPKREKGEKKLKLRIFKDKNKKKDRERKAFFQWFKDLLKQKNKGEKKETMS